MPYWRLHYHLVWATFGRLPVLTADLGPAVYRSMYARAKRLGVILHAVGGIEDHVHVVASVPPRLAVAECVGQLKGASAHTANEVLGAAHTFRWQTAYGALSLEEGSLPGVIAYVRQQHQHHCMGSLLPLYEHPGDGGPGSGGAAISRPVQGAPGFSRVIHHPVIGSDSPNRFGSHDGADGGKARDVAELQDQADRGERAHAALLLQRGHHRDIFRRLRVCIVKFISLQPFRFPL